MVVLGVACSAAQFLSVAVAALVLAEVVPYVFAAVVRGDLVVDKVVLHLKDRRLARVAEFLLGRPQVSVIVQDAAVVPRVVDRGRLRSVVLNHIGLGNQ